MFAAMVERTRLSDSALSCFFLEGAVILCSQPSRFDSLQYVLAPFLYQLGICLFTRYVARERSRGGLYIWSIARSPPLGYTSILRYLDPIQIQSNPIQSDPIQSDFQP